MFPAPNCTFVLPFLPPLPSLIGNVVSIGLVSMSTDLVSVTVSGGLQSCHGYLRALLWAHGSRLVARPRIATHYDRHHPQAHLFAMSLTKYCIPISITGTVANRKKANLSAIQANVTDIQANQAIYI